MVSLPSLQFSVKADLSGLKSVDRELTGLDTKGKSVGQSIGNALKQSANDAASAFRAAGGKGGDDFGEQFQRGADSKVKDTFGRLVTGAKNAGSDAGKGFGGAFKGAIGNIFQGIAQGIGQQLTAGLGSAISGLKGLAIDRDAIASYDKARAQVSTLTEDMAGMAAMAQEVSKAVGGSASQTEILAASYDVLSAGFSEAADAASILTNAQKGAIGGMSDMNTVSNATTTILNAYGLAAKDADKVVNQMIGTQNAGKIVVGEYASMIGNVATTAAQAGVPLEELNAFIATATVKGVKASSAIDGMRSAISAVLKPSQEASEYAAQLGVNFSAAGLRAGGLSGIMAQLREKNADSADSLVKLFGSVEAVAAIIPSAGDGMEDFAKNLETIKGASADDAFNKMSNSIEGLSKKNAVLREELALKFQIATAPLFEAANNGMTTLLQSLNEGGVLFEGLNKAAAGFRDFLAQNPEIISTMTAAFTELLNGGILLLQDSIIGFTNALRENPQLIQQMVEGLAGGVQGAIAFGQGMGQALTSIGQMLAPLAQLVGAMTGATQGANSMAGAFGQIVVYAAVFGPIVSALTSVVSLGTSIVGIFGGWVGIQAAISTGLATIAGYLGTILAAVPPIALSLGAVFVWVENIKNYSANWNDVLLGVQQTWQDLTGWVSGVFDWIGQLVSRSEVFQGVWQAVTGVIQFLIKPYQDLFNSIVSIVQKSEFFKGIWDGMKGVIDGIGKAFTSVVGGALDGLIQKAQGLWQQLQQMAGFGGGGAQGMNGGGNASSTIAGVQLPPEIAAFIEMFRVGEGTEGDKGFTTMFTGKQFQGFADHPRQLQSGGGFTSDAAGMGQFLSTTWDEVAKQIGAKDFSPENQVKGIVQLIKNRGAYDDLMQGRLDAALDKLSHEWASLPTGVNAQAGRYGQPAKTGAEAQRIYNEKLSQMKAGQGGGGFGGGAGGIAGFASSFPGGGTVGFKGVQVTSAVDASGEPGLDYVVEDGRRGANFGSVTNGRVIETVTNQNWETNLENNPGGQRGYGNQVIVRTIDEKTGEFVDLLYAHLDKVAVQVGQEVQVGTILGTQGRTGSTTGAHVSLDFFGKDSNATTPAAIAMRDRIASQLANNGGASPGNGRVPGGGASPSFGMTQQFATGMGGGNNAVGAGGKIDNTVANAKADKAAETQAMNAAVKAARDKEDAATKTKREEAARKLKQDREASKLKLEGSAAGLTTPEAKEASARALKELEIRAQYEDRLLDLEQKRDDLVKARDRKKTDMASKDVGTAAAAKAMPDFSAQIKSYDALIAKDKELMATALKNIGIADDAKQAELDRTAAIANRNAALSSLAELEKSEGQLALERAARTNPILASQIQFANQRKELQSQLNKELQDELDKLEDIERKLAELAKVGQTDSPEIRRLNSERDVAEIRIANAKNAGQNRLTGLDEAENFEKGKLKRDRDMALLDKDSMMASGGIEARRKTGARMREFGNVDGANKIEKEAALTELTLSYRQKQLALESKIAEMRSKGVEVSEAEAQSMRDQISALEQADLSNLNRQFDTFQSEIMPTIQSSLGGFFKTLMDGSKSVDEAFTDMIGNITNKIFEFAANQIVSSLLGGMFGGGAGGGFGGGIMKIFGFADGGIVEAQNNIAPYRSRPDAIGAALRKEGSNSVLAALTPGEMVLTTRQTAAFLNNPMAQEVLNFNSGGIVGRTGSPILSQNNASNSGGNVNIALNVDGGRSEMDYAMVAKVAQRAASGEISRQQKPRGSLAR